MKRISKRSFAAWTTMAYLLFACGGQTAGTSPPSGTGGGAAGGTGGGAGDDTVDAGISSDAGGIIDVDGAACVDIDTTTYDTSCASDTDCIDVSAGVICSGYTCLCGGSTINADGQARYQAQMALVSQGTGPFCSCPYFGRPRCIKSQCTFCMAVGPSAPGCPDGG